MPARGAFALSKAVSRPVPRQRTPHRRRACSWRVPISVLASLLASAPTRAERPDRVAHFTFREPRPAAYRVEVPSGLMLLSAPRHDWLLAWPDYTSADSIGLGSRVVLQLESTNDLHELLRGRPLAVARRVSPNTFVLQAPDAWTAANQAQALARLPRVTVCCPVMRRRASLEGPYAARPNDPYYRYQWNLENRRTNGELAGADLNVRAAWPYARGDKVVIALGDDGVDVSHPELAPRLRADLSYNFVTDTNSGAHTSDLQKHGTAVAGLAVAEGNNLTGMIGVAYRAQLASWVIFDDSDQLANDEALAQMFESESNVVSVQNHSWGNAGVTQLAPSLLERIAISNAILYGRDGRGEIIVRSGGNNRLEAGNVNDDGYARDPMAVAVGAVRADGRVASYSSPGAALLVAAPGGDQGAGFPTLFTTDRQGALGYNQAPSPNGDYVFNDNPSAFGFSGTSGAAPQIAGLAALLLSANPNLNYRDVQQILLNSARQIDPGDPDLHTNGAGFAVSHNVGFGVPDAGLAVRLARHWINRPAATQIVLTAAEVQGIPDDGLRLLISGPGVPPTLASVRTTPSSGPHADAPTPRLPLADLGMLTNAVTNNLTGQAALIQRGLSLFADKIDWAAQAGAAFAVIYDNQTNNNPEGTNLILMAGTDFTSIPAVFIDKNDGDALHNLLLINPSIRAQIHLATTDYTFAVTNTLLCEHVGVRLETDHPRRGDVRITLLSPQGTRSVLQQLNNDSSPGPVDWTYYTTHDFYESSAGPWTVAISDERPGNTGAVVQVSLIIRGVPITDTDHDGLDDHWEMYHFGTLAYGPADDPDHDGFSNMREQILGTDPNSAVDVPLALDLSTWTNGIGRLSWQSSTNWTYEVWASRSLETPLTLLTNLPGGFPETEWFVPYDPATNQFFRVRAVPP